GVQRQYSGTAGRTENCQIGVFLAYASARGHALIDRELYLPASWTGDRDRCRAAGVPDEVEFATKPRQAQAMIARALAAGAPLSRVTPPGAYRPAKILRGRRAKRPPCHLSALPPPDTPPPTRAAQQRPEP